MTQTKLTARDQAAMLECDNSKCYFIAALGRYIWGKHLIGTKCPSCGQNLLTARDFKTCDDLLRLLGETDVGDPNDPDVLPIKVHSGIAIGRRDAQKRMETVYDIISDEEIKRVHAGLNFGDMSARDVLKNGVERVADRCDCHSAVNLILINHGLTWRAEFNRPRMLSAKGLRYLAATRRASEAARYGAAS